MMGTNALKNPQSAGHGDLSANDPASLARADSIGAVDVTNGVQRYGWTMNGVAIEVVIEDGHTYVNGDLVHVVKQNN